MRSETTFPIDAANISLELAKYRPHIVQCLRRHGCPDPEGAATEVMIRVWNDVQDGETIRDPAAYVATVSFNYSREQKRKRANREQQLPENFEPASAWPSYDLTLDIQSAIGQLAEPDKQLLQMAELSREELAARFDTSVPAITARLKRLRKRLAIRLGLQSSKRVK